MELKTKLNSLQPRYLRFRGHQKITFFFTLFFGALVLAYWGYKVHHEGTSAIAEETSLFSLSVFYFFLIASSYFFWFKPRFKRSVQVFPTHLLIHDGKKSKEMNFSEIDSVGMVYWSLFYFKLHDGTKFYFNSSIERADYIWEGVKNARPDLLSETEYEDFRLKLVQYDHHQKRKEWFFKHKLLDAFNWLALPGIFLAVGFYVQSKDVLIHQPGMYFFRLFMYALLILLFTGFVYSLSLKKLIFDKKIENKMGNGLGEKIRDMEFEGVILHRSKIFQMFTASFLFALLLYTNVNLYSVTRVKEEVTNFNIRSGKTIMIDNRFNCFDCRYQLTDGDLVVFGRGFLGQIMAKEGEFVGEISQDNSGRMIASENVQEVPTGHVAVKSANGRDIMFIKMQDVVGKIRH